MGSQSLYMVGIMVFLYTENPEILYLYNAFTMAYIKVSLNFRKPLSLENASTQLCVSDIFIGNKNFF